MSQEIKETETPGGHRVDAFDSRAFGRAMGAFSAANSRSAEYMRWAGSESSVGAGNVQRRNRKWVGVRRSRVSKFPLSVGALAEEGEGH